VSVVVNEFEVVTAPTAVPAGMSTGHPGADPAGQHRPDPWAAVEVAEGQRRLAERMARLEAH
jgi:hypothetical protein